MKSELEISETLKYTFSDEEEYQGKKFVSIHKQSKFKGQIKHQNLTARPEDWPQVKGWLADCLIGTAKQSRKEKEEDVPF